MAAQDRMLQSDSKSRIRMIECIQASLCPSPHPLGPRVHKFMYNFDDFVARKLSIITHHRANTLAVLARLT